MGDSSSLQVKQHLLDTLKTPISEVEKPYLFAYLGVNAVFLVLDYIDAARWSDQYEDLEFQPQTGTTAVELFVGDITVLGILKLLIMIAFVGCHALLTMKWKAFTLGGAALVVALWWIWFGVIWNLFLLYYGTDVVVIAVFCSLSLICGWGWLYWDWKKNMEGELGKSGGIGANDDGVSVMTDATKEAAGAELAETLALVSKGIASPGEKPALEEKPSKTSNGSKRKRSVFRSVAIRLGRVVSQESGRGKKRRSVTTFKAALAEEVQKRELEGFLPVRDTGDIRDAVTPLWRIDEEEQRRCKAEAVLRAFRIAKLPIEFRNNFSDLAGNSALKAPLTVGYRNRVDFTTAKCAHDGQARAGFLQGRFKDGFDSVGNVKDTQHISPNAARVAEAATEFLRQSDIDVYSKTNQSGGWRGLTVRDGVNEEGRSSHLAVWTVTSDTAERIEQDEKLRTDMRAAVSPSSIGSDSECVGMYYMVHDEVNNAPSPDTPVKALGETAPLYMSIAPGLKFLTGPVSFTQTNTPGAQLLLETVSSQLKSSGNGLLFDVCCGSGFFGVSLAARHPDLSVRGVDFHPASIEEARENSAMNGVSGQTEWHHGRAEVLLPTLLEGLDGKETVAVVDPPRAGLHHVALKALERTEGIKSLIYVSCNPLSLGGDLTKMCGEGKFRVSDAAVLDLFPGTAHCEVVLRLDRD